MMMKSIILSVLFVALSFVSANQQIGEVPNAPSVPVSVQPPQSPVQVVGPPQSSPVEAGPVGAQPPLSAQPPVVAHHDHDHQHVGEHHHVGEPHHHHHHHVPAGEQSVGASYYSPAGVIQVVGGEQQQQEAGVVGGQKPAGAIVNGVRNTFEQYGHPESAAIPANYKPFGSWGLYIGGNPADGYYTNYYKALGSSVEKQQQQQAVQGGEVKPSSAVGPQQVVSQAAAFGPILRQAGSSPFGNGADYYPFAYSTSDFSSAVNNKVVPLDHYPGQQQPASGYVVSAQQHPVVGSQVVPQVYASSFEHPMLTYSPDSYASTKKLGPSAFVQREVKEPQQQQQQQPQQQQSKGYQQRFAYFSYPQAAPAPVVVQQLAQPQQQQQQVVAYPVPVGSQIVGSQQGVDGAFAPYGIHAFTRYAVKPAVVQSPVVSY